MKNFCKTITIFLSLVLLSWLGTFLAPGAVSAQTCDSTVTISGSNFNVDSGTPFDLTWSVVFSTNEPTEGGRNIYTVVLSSPSINGGSPLQTWTADSNDGTTLPTNFSYVIWGISEETDFTINATIESAITCPSRRTDSKTITVGINASVAPTLSINGATDTTINANNISTANFAVTGEPGAMAVFQSYSGGWFDFDSCTLTSSGTCTKIYGPWPPSMAGTSYDYQVVVGGRTSNTATLTFNPIASPPATPTGLSAIPGSCGSNLLNVSWNASTGATNYKVYRDGGATPVYDSSGLSFSDNNGGAGFVPGSVHSYTVKASNVYGSSPLSSSASGTVASSCSSTKPQIEVTVRTFPMICSGICDVPVTVTNKAPVGATNLVWKNTKIEPALATSWITGISGNLQNGSGLAPGGVVWGTLSLNPAFAKIGLNNGKVAESCEPLSSCEAGAQVSEKDVQLQVLAPELSISSGTPSPPYLMNSSYVEFRNLPQNSTITVDFLRNYLNATSPRVTQHTVADLIWNNFPATAKSIFPASSGYRNDIGCNEGWDAFIKSGGTGRCTFNTGSAADIYGSICIKGIPNNDDSIAPLNSTGGVPNNFKCIDIVASRASYGSLTSPTGLTAALKCPSPTPPEVEVRWNAVTGATGYDLYRTETSRPSAVRKYAGISSTSYTDSDFAPTCAVQTSSSCTEYVDFSRYVYWVVAYSGSSRSSRSAQVAVSPTTCPTATPDLTAGPISPTTAVVNTPLKFSATISNNSSVSTGASPFSNHFRKSTGPGGTGTLSSISVNDLMALGPSGSAVLESNSDTFSSAGTYYVQVCADNNALMSGTVNEGTNEGNNCSAWAPVVVSVNSSPTVDAGPDQTKTLPVSSTSMAGSALDSDGSISSTVWTKISGPAATISTPSSPNSNITGLTAGTYVFRLTATDNLGATGYDEMQLIVNPAVVNYGLEVKKSGQGTVTGTYLPAAPVQTNINCGATCLVNYNSGTNVTLTASPASGRRFTGWTVQGGGSCSGTGSCTVTVNSAKIVTANFVVLPNFKEF